MQVLPYCGYQIAVQHGHSQYTTAWFRFAEPICAQGSLDLALQPRVLPRWRAVSQSSQSCTSPDLAYRQQLPPGWRSTLPVTQHATSPSSRLDPARDGLAGSRSQSRPGIPSSWRKAGLSSPCGARYSWANSRAWSMAPPRTSSMRRCCCRWNARACLVSRICTPGRGAVASLHPAGPRGVAVGLGGDWGEAAGQLWGG